MNETNLPRFSVVHGLFAYEYESRMGLFEHYTRTTSTWKDLKEHWMLEDSRNIKVLYFIRHAEGYHNAAEKKYGTQVWDDTISKQEEYLDAALNPAGIADVQRRSIFMKTELDQGMPLDKIIVSPLTRTIETATLYFNLTTNTKYPVEAMESCRETLGVHTCDKRQPASTLKRTFPYVNWSQITHENDPWWQMNHRETDAEIELRCREFLDELFSTADEKFIAVVSHGGFIRACMNVLSIPSYKPRNCEVIPVAIHRQFKDDADDVLSMPSLFIAAFVLLLSYRSLQRVKRRYPRRS